MKLLTMIFTLLTFATISGQAMAESRTISCSSIDFAYKTCDTGGRIMDVRVSSQMSDTTCIENVNWGYDRDYIWVDNGCRARFTVQYRRGGGRTQNIRCSSNNFAYNTCYVDGRIQDAMIVRQHSDSSCVEGRSWGYSSDYIWVDNGCRATFQVRTRRSRF